MAECKECGKSFHTCPSCGLIGHEYNYCKEACWNKSEEKKELNALVARIDIDILKQMVSDDFEESDFWAAVDDRIAKVERE